MLAIDTVWYSTKCVSYVCIYLFSSSTTTSVSGFINLKLIMNSKGSQWIWYQCYLIQFDQPLVNHVTDPIWLQSLKLQPMS